MQLRKVASVVAVGSALVLAGSLPALAFGGGGAHGGGGHGGGGFGGGHAGGFGGGHFGGGGGRSFGAANVGGLQSGRSVAAGQNAPAASFAQPNASFANRGGIGGHGFNGRRGYGGRYGYGVAGLGLGYGYDDGFYGPDYADDGYDGGYGYGYPYGAGVQYSQDQGYDTEAIQTGRSAATVGDTCSTPVKACELYHQSYVGSGCSCRVPGGHAHGRVTP